MPAERIGETLVREGLVTAGDVAAALALARVERTRLASTLVAMGKLAPDDASRALAQQHGVPAALIRHLEGRDTTLTGLLPAGLARSLAALPLATSRGLDALVVCVRDPSDATAAALQTALARPIVMAVAVESLLLPLVAEAYPPDETEEFDIDLDTDPQAMEISAHAADPLDPDALELQLVDLDDQGVSRDFSQMAPAPTRSGASFQANDTDPGLMARDHDRRISGPFAAVNPPAEPASWSTEARQLALDPALIAVNTADSRDEVLDALLSFLRHRFAAAVVFVVREGLALGQAGFGNDAVDDAIRSLVVPLTQPSVLRVAHDGVATFVGAPTATSVVQDRFFRLFGAPPSRVVVVPVAIKDRVVNLLYAHAPRSTSIEDAAVELGTLASAAEDAFIRIIREQKQ